MKIINLFICFTLLLSLVCGVAPAEAVPKMVKAKPEYLLAEKLLNQGDNPAAIEHALRAKSLLGQSNSRIEYLLIKAYNAQGEYGQALAALEEFFNVTPESMSGTQEYNEMVALCSEVENSRLEQIKQIETKEKEREALLETLSILSQQMVTVPGGCFKFGNYTLISGDDDERPPHKVCLDSFSIGKYEVTQTLWRAVMGNTPSATTGGTNIRSQMSVGRIYKASYTSSIMKLEKSTVYPQKSNGYMLLAVVVKKQNTVVTKIWTRLAGMIKIPIRPAIRLVKNPPMGWDYTI